MEKLRKKNPGDLPERARVEPPVSLDAVSLYTAYLELDRDDRGEPTTESMFTVLDRGLRIDPASEEGQRARRLWHQMRSIEREFHEQQRKQQKPQEDEAPGRKRGRRPPEDDEE